MNQAEHQKHNETFSRQCRQMGQIVGGREIEGGSHPLQISLRWDTHIKMYLTQTMKVGDRFRRTTSRITDTIRYTCTPLALLTRQSLAILHTAHQALPEPTHPPAYACCCTAGLESSMALDTTATRLDKSTTVIDCFTRRRL